MAGFGDCACVPPASESQNGDKGNEIVREAWVHVP